MTTALIVIDVQNEYVTGNLPIAFPPVDGSLKTISAAIDAAIAAGDLPSAIGSIAGDDTVMVVAKTPTGGNTLARELTALLDGEPVKLKSKSATKSSSVKNVKKKTNKNRGK